MWGQGGRGWPSQGTNQDAAFHLGLLTAPLSGGETGMLSGKLILLVAERKAERMLMT